MDDSSGSGDSEQGDDLLLEEIENRKKKVESSPYSYDDHVELIKLYRQAGDLDGARTARNSMAEIFPLSENLWLEWIRDELPLASLPEALESLKSLFERATEDYLSVQIWIEYCTFALEKMSDLGGMDFPRGILENAIMSVGLHSEDGSLIWNMYREFEMAIFRSLQEMQSSDETGDEELKQQVEAQYDRIDKLFKRQLSVPLCGIEDVLKEYQEFSDTVVNEEKLPSYSRAKKRLEIITPFEEELSSSSSLEAYLRYIDDLKQRKEEATLVNVMFQRALADHPLNSELWKNYMSYLDKNFAGIAPVLLKGHKQSVRNCPWVKELWVSYLQVQEKMKVPHEEIVATLDQAVGDNFSDSASFLELWTCYCDYLRRRTIDAGEPERTDLRKLFRRAREHLDTYFGRDGDPSDSLSLYQASVEACCYSNMEEARLLWTDVMTHHGREASYWIKYANLERVYGDPSLCRKILLMAVNSASDDPERVCNELIQFEREQGTLETYLSAVERCAAQLARVKNRRDKAQEKEQVKKGERKQQRKERRKVTTETTGGKRGNETTQFVPAKRKRQQQALVFYDEEEEEREGTAKKTKADVSGSSEAMATTPVGTVPEPNSVEKMEVQIQKQEPEEGRKEGEGKEYDPLKWLARDEGAVEKKKPNTGSLKERKEQTVFVSNLTFGTTENQLKDVFQNCGEIADIRLIKTRKSGGVGNIYAYVEFESTKPVQQALLMDRQMLNNRPMFVSPCNEDRDFKPRFSDSADKSTVFVTNIPHDVNEQQLQDIFQEAGVIKEVRLVRNRQGRSKGFAYIEYITESSASAAIIKLNEHLIYGKKLNVAISRPPSKSGAEGSKPPTTRPRSYQSSSEAMDQPFSSTASFIGTRKSKSKISMLPRVVARKGPPPEADTKGNGGGGEETGIKKSNEDFRNLLLKKN